MIPAEDLIDIDFTSKTPSQAPDVPRPVNTKRNLSKRKEEENHREDEAYNIMKFAATQLTAEKDDAELFGHMIAAKIKKLTPRNRTIAEHQIHNLLFQIQMQEMDSLPNPQQLPQRPTWAPNPTFNFAVPPPLNSVDRFSVIPPPPLSNNSTITPSLSHSTSSYGSNTESKEYLDLDNQGNTGTQEADTFNMDNFISFDK